MAIRVVRGQSLVVFLASLKTLLISTKATCLTPKSTSRASFSLAGFQVTLIGRFWVTPEDQAVGVRSTARTATFTNTQATALTISSITISGGTAPGDYAWEGNCPLSPSTLSAGESCSINVTFTPAALGSLTTTLTVTHSASTSPQSVALSGTGVAPVTLSSPNLAFGNQAQGTGTGKSHLAQAIGQAAIQKGYRVLYRETHKLLDDLAEATIDGTRRECMERFVSVPLLIIDDLGMRKLPKTAAEDLLEIVMRRYERASSLLTSNRPVDDWGKLLGDSAAVTAMLDRLLHHGHVLKCGPRSWRTKTDLPPQEASE